MRTIQPDELRSETPYRPWSCRGRDIWDAFCAANDGDVAGLRRLLASDPNLYRAEYWYTQPIHFAVREGQAEAVRLLLEAGADTGGTRLDGNLIQMARDRGHATVLRLLEDERERRGRVWPVRATADPAIHAAAEANDVARVRALLDAEPDLVGSSDAAGGSPLHRGVAASGSATYAARTPELRKLLLARGGRLDTYDLVWLGEDDDVVRRVKADPASADAGCGGVFAAACKEDKRELLVQLIDAGARVPKVLTPCRSYLMSEPDTLRLLLAAGGMDPNLPNWQRATPLHDLCGRDGRGRPNRHRVECATILLDAGASLGARDEDYRSTPLAWAARNGLPDMVELLLERGAAARLPDDEHWATPLAWATRRGHVEIAGRIRKASASASV